MKGTLTPLEHEKAGFPASRPVFCQCYLGLLAVVFGLFYAILGSFYAI